MFHIMCKGRTNSNLVTCSRSPKYYVKTVGSHASKPMCGTHASAFRKRSGYSVTPITAD